MNSIGQRRIRKVRAKSFAFWPKNEESIEDFQENFKIFWSQSPSEIDFFHIFTKYFLYFWFRSESLYLWKRRTDFYNISSNFGWGNVPASSPLLAKQLAVVKYHLPVAPAVREHRDRSPPRNWKKIVVEKWCYFRRLYF